MDNLGIEEASLIGNSGGGSISTMFSLRHPERVDRLVLVDSGGLGRSVSWFLRIASLPLVGKLLHLHTIDSDRALVASIFHKPRPIDPEIARELRRARNSWHTRMAVVQAIRAGFNIFGVKKELILLDQLEKLDVPLFIVWGEKDGILPVSHALEASQRLPNAKLHIMRGCGHWPHMESPEEFNRVAIQFLEEPESVKGATGWPSRKA
jgi:4,5:9,10-diseco-3-hydroxy-5,9,17-trioxoandrosta-1(10),2-diene-4-oate hydrolase